MEVLNDLDGEVVNFFRVCHQHYEELIGYLRYVLVSRKWFEVLKVTDPATLTDVQRGTIPLSAKRLASLVVRPSYHLYVVQPPGFNVERLPQLIDNAHKRLALVQIECLPTMKYSSIMTCPATAFYLDPPYWGKKRYQHSFKLEFEKLADLS